MRKSNRVLIALFLMCFIIQICVAVSPLKALELKSNIILLIDNSGSMKNTDPNKLSIVAASMLIDTVEGNTNLNVIAFGDKALSLNEISDKPSKEQLKEELKNLKFDNNNTNLKEGINEAINELKDVEGEKTIIVLSDGKEDPAGGLTDSHMKELYSLSEEAHKMKIKIHCIGLSEYADEEALSRLTFKTGGEYLPCGNASELFNAFSKILGNLNDFYTIEEFTTDVKKEKEIKLSSYIEEVIIKVASCDNNSPMVDVVLNEKELAADSIGDKYKLYKISNNSENSTIKITSRDESKNSVIVQIKSKGKIAINSSNDNISLPFNIPMNIEATLQIDKTIMGLHMDKLEGGNRESINKVGEAFRFIVKKDKPGQYPMLITAYDGEGNIIAVKDININIKNYPPFYYTRELPSTIVTENSFIVELKQQDNSKVNSPSGEVYIEYSDKYESFPLKIQNGLLQAEVVLKTPGDIKITTQLNGVRDNEDFSYYLPYLKASVVEKAYVEIESESYKQPFKEGQDINLKLNIKNNHIYISEEISIYDKDNNLVGEIGLTPKTTGVISVPIKIKCKGENLSFSLKPKSDIKVNSRLNTNLRILSKYYYPVYRLRIILIIIGILILLITFFVVYGEFIYRTEIKSYKVSKTIYYKIGSNYMEKSLDLTLSSIKSERERYISVTKDLVSIDEERTDNTIGYFTLKIPRSISFVEGWKYKLSTDKNFPIDYTTLETQEVYLNDELVPGKILFRIGTKIILRKGKNIVTISFE